MKERMKRLVAFMLAALLLVASSGEVMPQVYAASGINRSESKTMRGEASQGVEETQSAGKARSQEETQDAAASQSTEEAQSGKETQNESQTGEETQNTEKGSDDTEQETPPKKDASGKDKKTEKEDGTGAAAKNEGNGETSAGVKNGEKAVAIGGTDYTESAFKEEIKKFFDDPVLGSVVADTIWTSVLEPDALKTGYNTLAENGAYILLDNSRRTPKRLEECQSIEDVLVNYCGGINASQKGIKSTSGVERMTFAGFINLSRNSIESIEILGKNATGENGIQDRRSGINLQYNPLHTFPLWLQNTVNTHYQLYSVPTTYWEVPLLYLYGNTHNPQLHFELYQPQAGNPVKYSGVSVTGRGAGGNEQKILEIMGISAEKIKSILEEEAPLALTLPCSGNKDGTVQIGYNYSVHFKTGSGPSLATNHYSFLNYYTLNINYISRIKSEARVSTTGGFQFSKYHKDAGDKVRVQGAVYKLYSDPEATKPVKGGDGKELEYTTDESGSFQASGLASGTYYLKEIKAPEGFGLNPKIYKITVAPAEIHAAIDGGYDSITPTADNAKLVPDWGNMEFGTIDAGDDRNSGAFQVAQGKPLEKTEDVMYTSNSKLDGYGQDDRSIRHLQNELTVAASAKYQEKSNIKIIMTDPEGKESTVKEGMTSLKEAKAFMNDLIVKGKLEGNYTIKTDTSYTAVDTTINENAYTGSDEALPVYVKLAGSKEVQGAKSEDEILKAGEYSFQITKESGPAGEGGQQLPETAKNNAQGEFSFSALKFTQPGEYIYKIREVIPKESEPEYNPDISYDKSEKTITVNVTADTKGLKAVVSADGKELLTVTSADTANSDGTLKADADITAETGAFVNKYLPELTVSKVVTGAFGDRTKDFEISVEIDGYTGEALFSSGEIQDAKVSFQNGKITAIETADESLLRDGAILLKHGESFTLRRLPLGYQYTVSEGKDSAEGYTVSYSCSDSDAEIIQGEKLSASLKPGAQSAEVENKKELIPQTGIWGGGAGGFIVMAIALLGIASIIFARFLKRRGIRKKI